MVDRHVFLLHLIGKDWKSMSVYAYGTTRGLFLIVADMNQATLPLLCSVCFLWLGRDTTGRQLDASGDDGPNVPGTEVTSLAFFTAFPRISTMDWNCCIVNNAVRQLFSCHFIWEKLFKFDILLSITFSKFYSNGSSAKEFSCCWQTDILGRTSSNPSVNAAENM